VTDPYQVHVADVLIIAVKTYDTATALESLKHLQVASVVSIQNGVLKNAQLAAAFGWEKVLGAMAAFTAEVLPSGTVLFTVNQGFYLGEWPTGTSARVQALATTLEQAGIVAPVTGCIQSLEWSKYVAFVAVMVPAVLTHLETPRILQNARTAEVMARIVHEMAAIAQSHGIAFADTSLFPTRTLSELSISAAVERLHQLGKQFGARAPHHKISTLQDVEQGKRLEVEETLGYLVQQGIEHGVPTPTMELCYQLIAGLNQYLQ
jgi:2-dehydropantoate 2-reductase